MKNLSNLSPRFALPLSAIAFIWTGLVLGLSFIETPLKFQAPGITLALGVGIGRLVFSTLNHIEIVLCGLLFALLWLGRGTRSAGAAAAAVIGIVLLQTFWLLPLLDARAQLLLDGHPPPPDSHHMIYIVLDAAKLAALFTLGILTGRRAG